jgi:ribosome-binding factor A
MPRTDSRRSGAAPTQRQLRVGELIRHALAEVLARGEVHDPAVEASTISVTEVAVSSDLKLATCYVMSLGEADIAPVVEALERNRKFLRGAVTKRIDLRFSPELRFKVDTSFETGERIDALLRSPAVRRDIDRDGDES